MILTAISKTSHLVASLFGENVAPQSITPSLRALSVIFTCQGIVTSVNEVVVETAPVFIFAAFISIARASAFVILSSGRKVVFSLLTSQISDAISTALQAQLFGLVLVKS